MPIDETIACDLMEAIHRSSKVEIGQPVDREHAIARS
jgi:hypothetical protein